MSPQPGSNRLLPLEPADGQTVLSADASRNDRQTQVTPVQAGLQGFPPSTTMWIFNHGTAAHSPVSNGLLEERKVAITRQTAKSKASGGSPNPR